MQIQPYLATARMAMRAQTNMGLAAHLPRLLAATIRVVPLLVVWRVILLRGADVGMSLSQMLAYTFAGALLSDVLEVRTALSAWNYDGRLVSLYQRPMPVLGHVVAQTVGGWAPALLFFSIPLLLLAPLAGLDTVPATLWFFPSVLLGTSLGFAVDFLFACLTIRLRGMAWMVYAIRMALVSLLSGAVIPFAVMPFGLDRILAWQPLGSLAGAPLSLLVGTGDPVRVLLVQAGWNLALWPLAVVLFARSRERMASYGG
ncbi:MAG: hypothetical protein KBA30_02665 [Clostridia bacterium]|nr:hypothetical protein [Clostridia bacterium]